MGAGGRGGRGCNFKEQHMSTFHQPQHYLARSAVSSGEFETFGSIVMDPSMVTLDLPFYVQKIQVCKEPDFVVPD